MLKTAKNVIYDKRKSSFCLNPLIKCPQAYCNQKFAVHRILHSGLHVKNSNLNTNISIKIQQSQFIMEKDSKNLILRN